MRQFSWCEIYKFYHILQSLGNHEFDEGADNLAKFLREIDFPVLAANLNLDGEPELKSATSMQPSIVFNVTGRQVGIIGYLTPETKDVAVPNHVEFIDEVEALKWVDLRLTVYEYEVIELWLFKVKAFYSLILQMFHNSIVNYLHSISEQSSRLNFSINSWIFIPQTAQTEWLIW